MDYLKVKSDKMAQKIEGLRISRHQARTSYLQFISHQVVFTGIQHECRKP